MPDINILINAKDQASSTLKGVGGEVDSLNTKADSAAKGGLASLGNALGAGIAASVAIGGAALAALGGAVLVTGTNFNSMKEQATIAFTTMLGSGQQAKVFLDDLQQFAAKTPFEFPELLQASQRLLAMGFAATEVKPTLTAVGDAVAALGGGSEMVGRVTTALGQMQAKGKASGEEMMQLTEAGIPAWQMLADAIGTNVADAMDQVSKGTITADVAIAALVDGMNTKFGGLMEKQSQTFGGLFSTIKDTFTQVSGEVTAPLFAQMTAGLSAIVDWTNKPEFTSGVKALSEWIGKTTGEIVKWTKDVWPNVLSVLKSVYDAIQLVITGDFRGGFFGFKEGDPFIKALKLTHDTIGFLIDAVAKIIKSTWDWGSRVLPPLAGGLFKVVDVTGSVIGAVKGLFKPVADAIAKFLKIDDVIGALAVLMAGPALAAIWGLVTGLAAFLAPIAAVVTAIAGLRFAWEQNFLGIRTFTLSTLQKLSDWFFEESGIWKGTFEETMEYLTWWASGGWKNNIYFPIRSALNEIRSEITTWTLWTQNKFAEWVQKGKDTIAGWKNDIVQTFTIWKDRAVSTFEDFFGPKFKLIDDWVARTASQINSWVQYWKDKLQPWYDWVIEKFQGFLDWWETNIDPWVDYGVSIVQGLWNGMKELWKNFTDWLSDRWDEVTTTFEYVFGIDSPSKLFASYGRFLMEGLAGGIAEHQSLVTQQVESMTNSVTAQMERLKGAMVQNVFDINQAAQQLKINPALLPTALGGTGKVVGLGPNGELIMEGITNLPKTGTPTAPPPTPLVPAANTLLNAIGGPKTTTGISQDLLGGISVGTGNIQELKNSIDSNTSDVKQFIKGIGVFLKETAANTKIWTSLELDQQNNAKGLPELRTAQSDLVEKLRQLLGIDVIYGGLSENNIKAAVDKITAGTDINRVKDLLQSAVTFRQLANHYSTADFTSVLPTDPRLTGQPVGSNTTNQFNITVQGGNSATSDIMGLIPLLNSLYGTAAP